MSEVYNGLFKKNKFRLKIIKYKKQRFLDIYRYVKPANIKEELVKNDTIFVPRIEVEYHRVKKLWLFQVKKFKIDKKTGEKKYSSKFNDNLNTSLVNLPVLANKKTRPIFYYDEKECKKYLGKIFPNKFIGELYE